MSQRNYSTQNNEESNQLVDYRFTVKINEEEDSRYTGPALIEPKTPYHVDYKPRQVDPELTRFGRIKQKLSNVTLDTSDYLMDIVLFRHDLFSYKTAYFVKRNYHKIAHALHHFWDELKKVGQGFKKLNEDFKFFVRFQKRKIDYKYDKVTYKDQHKLGQVKSDFIKFIPFSIFIIVPGAELLLPAWLMVFPNSIPSQFLSEDARYKQFKQMTEKRNNAAEKLLYILPKYLYSLEKDESVEKEDKDQVRQLKHILRSENVLPTDLLQFRQLFQKYAQFKYFGPSTLLHIAHFMSLNPVTGLNTINNILRAVKVRIPIEAPIIRIFTKMILTRELTLYFNRLRREDEVMSFEQVEKFSEEELNQICFRRGIEIHNKTYDQKMKDLKLWMSISNLRNVPHSLLLYSRIADFASEDLFEISEDEDEYEVLRRAQSEIYFIEKMRVFEKTFGIDQLHAMVKKLEHQRKHQTYNPAEGKFIFNKNDLALYAMILDEFETRHKTLSDKIEQTYRVGNLMLDYLEKQLILDYHLRGEQAELEKEHPELAEKAKKYLGFELYYELSSQEQGKPIPDDSEIYKQVMKKVDELNDKFQQDNLMLQKQSQKDLAAK